MPLTAPLKNMVDGFYRPWKSNKKTTKVIALAGRSAGSSSHRAPLLCSLHCAAHLRAATLLPVPHRSVLVPLAYAIHGAAPLPVPHCLGPTTLLCSPWLLAQRRCSSPRRGRALVLLLSCLWLLAPHLCSAPHAGRATRASTRGGLSIII
jgi:hypothetical protein